MVAKLRCEGTRVVVLVPYWRRQRWFQDLYAISCAQVRFERDEAQSRKEGDRHFMPVAGWDTMLLKIDTTSKSSPAPRKSLTNGESGARSFVLEARSAAYGEDLCLSCSTGFFPWVKQCEFGLMGQLPVRVLKGGGGLELVMRVKARGSDVLTFWVRALVDTGSQSYVVRGDRRQTFGPKQMTGENRAGKR